MQPDSRVAILFSYSSIRLNPQYCTHFYTSATHTLPCEDHPSGQCTRVTSYEERKRPKECAVMSRQGAGSLLLLPGARTQLHYRYYFGNCFLTIQHSINYSCALGPTAWFAIAQGKQSKVMFLPLSISFRPKEARSPFDWCCFDYFGWSSLGACALRNKHRFVTGLSTRQCLILDRCHGQNFIFPSCLRASSQSRLQLLARPRI